MWAVIDRRVWPNGRASLLLLAVGVIFATGLFRPEPTQGASLARATDYLRQHAVALGLQPGLEDMQAVGHKASLTADHFRYQQTIGGVPVLGAQVLVSVPRDGRGEPRVLNHYAAAARAALRSPAVSPVAPEVAFERARAVLGSGVRQLAAPELVYVPDSQKRFTLAWRLTLETKEPFGHWTVLSDAATGEPLMRISLLQYDSGRVFDPNPGQTNGGQPPAPDCDSPANEALLSSQYRTQQLQGILPGQGKLKGEFVDLTAPGISGGYKPAGLADEPSHQYVYRCDDDRFEEVMVYSYVDRVQRKIQSLGFTGERAILDRPISAHAHYNKDCDAFFSKADLGLHFGDGEAGATCNMLSPGLAPDAAEDGDIVVHEYGHAIQEEQVPGFGLIPPPFFEQPGAIAEGFGDFLAGVINGDACTAEYYRESIPFCNGGPGSSLDNMMNFPAGYETCPDWDYNGDGFPESEEIHCGGLIWGGALWDLVKAIGEGQATPEARDTTLRLVLESQFYLDQGPTFDEAAAAICYADGLLYGGEHQGLIALVFAARGISSGDCVPDDFNAAYFRVQHPFAGDLDVSIVVGPDTATPLCEVDLSDPNDFDFPGLVMVWTLESEEDCGNYLPPSPGQPFWLQVKDASEQQTGSIELFAITLRGGVRCTATDTPVAIPDNGPPVYSKVDCTNRMGPGAGTPTPTDGPTPTPPAEGRMKGDVDCDGSVDSVDGLRILRHVAGLDPNLPAGCPPLTALSGPGPRGDMDCNGTVDSVDSLRILRYTAGLDPGLPGGCGAIGGPVGGGSPTPTPTPSPVPTGTPGNLVVTRKSTWRYVTGGDIVLAGEVYNGFDYPVAGVTIRASYYSESNDLLATAIGFACLAAVPAGGDSPYDVFLVDPPAGIDAVTVEVTDYSGPPLLFPPPEGLEINVTDVYTDTRGDFHVAGEVVNNSVVKYRGVKVCSALYDAAGNVIDTGFDYAYPNTLGPGESGAFNTWVLEPVGVESYRVWVHAY